MFALSAVRRGLTTEVPSFHDTLRALAFAGAGDVDERDAFKIAHRNRVPHRSLGGVAETQLAVMPLGADAGFGVVTDEREGAVLGLGVAVADLDGVVTIIAVGGLDLRHDARTGLDDGDGDLLTIRVVNAGHANLFAKQCGGGRHALSVPVQPA